jgi:predicted metal-dependent HD superfamily phosphohydrolase
LVLIVSVRSNIEQRTQPMVYKGEAELISALADDPAAVGYAWTTDVARDNQGQDSSARMARLNASFATFVGRVILADGIKERGKHNAHR